MAYLSADTPRTVSQSPVCTGSSVIGMCFDGGVVIAADTLVSYGRMAKFRNVSRLIKVNSKAVAACSGDFADFQYLKTLIEQKQIEEETNEDGFQLSPRALHSWLTRVLYNRRSKFDPLWTTWAVGGIDNDGPFLGYVDKLGLAFKDRFVASGFGAHIAIPYIRKAYENANGSINRQEALTIIEKCITTLFERDCTAHSTYEVAVVDSKGSEIIGPLKAKEDWSLIDMTPKIF